MVFGEGRLIIMKQYRSNTARCLSRSCYRPRVVENKKKSANKNACRGGKTQWQNY